MTQTMFFSNSSFGFESIPIQPDFVPNTLEGAHFGILNIHAIPTPITQSSQEFIFVVDQSGSMSDSCSDGRTKMHHIIHTLKNMILYFKENQNIRAMIRVYSFDDKIYTIIERTNITEENVESILYKIDKLRPLGGTDIENALTSIRKIIEESLVENPLSEINHIFMTDGEATVGNTDKNVLKGLINTQVYNAFVGFGTYHDSHLLTFLGEYPKSGYYFVDALEKAGLVYGEILHYILYKLLGNVSIEVNQGLIYDFTSNTWVEKLYIGDIIGESQKTYHLLSNNVHECQVFVNGNFDNETLKLSIGRIHSEDSSFTNYVFRQRTLQLLYQAKEIQTKKNNYNRIWMELVTDQNINHETISAEKKIIKKNLQEFMEELKKYIEENNLLEDKFLKNLCDDVYISYRTLGTRYGQMYAAARQTSQGTQRCYTVSHIPGDEMDTNLQSFPFHGFQNNQFVRSNKLNAYELSDFADTPYLTPTATRLMRDISCGPSPMFEEDYTVILPKLKLEIKETEIKETESQIN